MVAGMERYYQIARCYRDEDFRADRQPEFTQLDVEMSFVDSDDVIAVAEEILAALWALIGYDLPRPIPRMTYADAMRRFGSDNPTCASVSARRVHRLLQRHPVPGVPGPLTSGGGDARRRLAAAADAGRLAGVGQTQRGAKGLAYVLIGEDGELQGPVAKNLSDAERDGLAAHVGANPGTACSSPPAR